MILMPVNQPGRERGRERERERERVREKERKKAPAPNTHRETFTLEGKVKQG